MKHNYISEIETRRYSRGWRVLITRRIRNERGGWDSRFYSRRIGEQSFGRASRAESALAKADLGRRA